MPPKPSCCCPQHAAWGHADDSGNLRIATEKEIRLCGVNSDGRHNNRKRRICISCRERFQLEKKCDQLQKTVENINENNQILESMVLTATVPVCDSQTQTDPSTSLVSTTSQGIQVGEFPNRPYQSYECRKQSELRTEIIEKIVDLFNIYVHGDSLALPNLVQDLLLSKKWSTTFCLPSNKDDSAVQDKVLHSIVKEYRECKNKEANSQIRKQGRKLNQAINISETLANSSIAFQGSTPDCFRSRQLRSQQQGAGVSGMPRATDSLPDFSPDPVSQPAIPDPTVPHSTPNPTISDRAVAVPTAVSDQPVQARVAPQAWIRASTSSNLTGVTEWSFSESQSDIQGRTGSNACVFIALYMGKA